MIQIKDTLVSLDVIDNFFCCDLEKCHGKCCIEGDAGAPITDRESKIIEKEWRHSIPFLNKKNIDLINKNGVAYYDEEGDLVTTIINKEDCVFSCKNDGICFCALEKAYNAGLSSFRKPSSCALYPIRITKYASFTAVNLHKWNICKEAFVNGKNLDIRVYEFLKGPLTDYFGQEWYDELELTAQIYLEQKKHR